MLTPACRLKRTNTHLLISRTEWKVWLLLALLGWQTLPLAQANPFATKRKQQEVTPTVQPFLPPSANVNDFIRPNDGHWLNAPKTKQATQTSTNPAEQPEGNELEPVTLIRLGAGSEGKADPGLDKSGVQLKAPLNRLDTPLLASPDKNSPTPASNGLAQTPQEALAKTHKALQEQELKNLWQATVQHNEVLRFSLEKLALPVDTQEKHSSYFLKKTLSSLISGAAIGASMMLNTGAYTNLGIMAGAQSVQNLVTGTTQPTEGVLSATEQIQLAGLVDDLKLQLLGNYRTYAQEVQHLAACHQRTNELNATYATALKKGDTLSALTSGSSYYKALLEETQAKQQAKLAQLNLERLAGSESVAQLQLALTAQQYQSLSGAQTALVEAPSTQKTLEPQTTTAVKKEAESPPVLAVKEAPKTPSPVTSLAKTEPNQLASPSTQQIVTTPQKLQLSHSPANAVVYSLVSQAKTPALAALKSKRGANLASRSSSYKASSHHVSNATPKGTEGPTPNHPLTLERFEDEL